MQISHRFELSALVVLVALSLTGCGKVGSGKDTQIAVKVNGDELTVHQLNFELAKLGNLRPEQARQAANQVLKSMVDEQLLVQKAISDKLDRDPQVVQTLDAARRQILAQALLQKLTANQPKPSDAEMADYFAKNSALFSDRRIYRLEEINIQVTPTNLNAVKAQLQQNKNLDDLMNWLKAQNIPVRAGQSTKAAEQLPLELLPRLQQMQNGQAVTFSAPGALNVLVLLDSQPQPLTLDQAKPMIARFLLNVKKREIAEAELKTLRQSGKIEYLGEYANVTTPAATPAASPANAGADAKSMQNGVSGLK